jgi:hypothetical protein
MKTQFVFRSAVWFFVYLKIFYRLNWPFCSDWENDCGSCIQEVQEGSDWCQL